MRFLIPIVVMLTFSPPAFAQQVSPSQLALQISTAVAGLANAAEQLPLLQSKLQASEARVKALEDKYESKKPDEKK
jgi:hypothetical protein